MKKMLLALSFVALSTISFAQQPEASKDFNLNVNTADIQIIGEGLSQMPYVKVAPLMQKLQQQINQQNMPKPVATPVVPAPEPEKK